MFQGATIEVVNLGGGQAGLLVGDGVIEHQSTVLVAGRGARLNELKLVGNTTEVESTEAPGTVVAQDRTGLLEQGTTVNLQIAKAKTALTVPSNLSGMTYNEAVGALNNAGLFNLQRQDVDSTEKKDVVVYTDPSGGSEVEADQLIVLYVSKGASPQAGTSPTNNN